ncbi:hypothetical protein [Peptostreptococcus equinus]|uniref:Uncharacterized protein n=1 Tax=Peptostreptococcus equinus TaxID=3003601 RepID=A0ABY7JMF0_9FIRM|nr:hypothetical protein [Peptostreptococcus sp. CBA3647]WAW14016.1 hypothetical protein O0R46_05265 [Peptostreptococcus sp. CBA3647]
MSNKKFISLLTTPVVLIVLFFGLRFGYINPMIKAIDIHINGGNFITNTNKYVVKVGDKLPMSLGNYVVVPGFSKKPDLSIVTLNNNGVVSIKDNVLIANKEGLATLGILNKNRVLRKVNIMVVNPKITNMEIKLSNQIKYVGDKASIKSFVDIEDYKKLSDGYKLQYSSTNPEILKVENNTIQATGVGECKLISKYARREIQTSFLIYPKVVSLSAKDSYNLEAGQETNIDVQIKTFPINKKSKVTYTVEDKIDENIYDKNIVKRYTDSGLRTIRGVDVTSDGKIKAYRPGRYKLNIKSGDRSYNTSIYVNKPSFENLKIENLQYFTTKKDNKISIELGWDYNERVDNYKVYMKNTDDDKFNFYSNINTSSEKLPKGNRLSQHITLENRDKKSSKYEFYVIGYNNELTTKKSDILTIDMNDKNQYQKLKVSNVKYKISPDNQNIQLSWDKLNKDTYSYRVYYANHDFKDKSYIMLAKNIKNNKVTIKKPVYFDSNDLNYDFYIVGISKKGQISDFSNPLAYKR